MYQKVIRDPGGGELIRIVPDICGPETTVVNGSILIVPAGTVAFVSINGVLSQPYGPGQYELFTGVDPLFVRLRNLMTNGDAAISVLVFFLSTEKTKFMQFGTGEVPFTERRFQLTMKALASCTVGFTIKHPKTVLEKLVGSYSSNFSEDDIEPCLQQIIVMPIREALAKELSRHDVAFFNTQLTDIRNSVRERVSNVFDSFGLGITSLSITGINIPEAEIQRLTTLESEFASGKTRTDLELDNLQRVWNGNVDRRTLSELMTGISSRGGSGTCRASDHSGGHADGMTSAMVQMMLLSQLLPTLREPLVNMTEHTDLFGTHNHTSQENTSTADAPPPVPGRKKRCPSCNGTNERNATCCPICGYRY